MFTFTVEIEKKENLLAALKKFRRYLKDMRPVWGEVQQEFYRIEKQLFDTQGASGKSGKWVDLSPKYKKFKLKNWGFIYPILHRTYALRATLTSEIPGSVVRKTRDSLEVGTSLPRARKLYENKRRPRRAIDVTAKQKQRLVLVAGSELLKLAKKEGF